MTTFGQNLQLLRRRTGLSQQQLAEQLGVSRQAISKWELDAAKPDLDNLLQISRLFAVSADELLTGAPPRDGAPRAHGRTAADWLRIWGIVLTAVGLLGILLAVFSTTWMQQQEMQTFHQCYTDAWEYLNHFPLAVVLWVGIGSVAAGIALFVSGMLKKDK